MGMLFHIRRSTPAEHVACGKALEDVYRSLTEHLASEASIRERPAWTPGDAVCLACIRKARPNVVKQLKACRAVKAGEWVVLCGCGGVRPYGEPCGRNPSFRHPTTRPPHVVRPPGGSPAMSPRWTG